MEGHINLAHLPSQSRVYDWVSPLERLVPDNTSGMSERSYDTQGHKKETPKHGLYQLQNNACQPKILFVDIKL